MRAAVIERLDGPGAVVVRDVPDPAAGPGQVLIDVHAAGVVFPDVLLTRGRYQLRPPLPFSPGAEVAGTVRVAAHGFAVGDRVAAVPVVGGMAEVVAADAALVFPLPDDVTFEAAAAIPLNYLTMRFAYGRRAKLQPGETVLVHGAAGGLGIAACQLAVAHGATVVAVVSSDAKAEVARAAGAQAVVRVDGFRDAVRESTDGRGVDVVVDPVGGERFTDSLRCLAPEGRLLVLGFTAGDIPTVKVNRLLLTNTTVMGVASAEFWRSDPGLPARDWADLLPLIRSGAIDPMVRAVYDLDHTADAIGDLDERRAVGRVVVRLR